MRGIWFTVVMVLAVALGLAALFEHRPDSRSRPPSAAQPAPSLAVSRGETGSPPARTEASSPGAPRQISQPANPPAGQGGEAAQGNAMPQTTGKSSETTAAHGATSAPAMHQHAPAPTPPNATRLASAQQTAAPASPGSDAANPRGLSAPASVGSTGDPGAGRQVYRKCQSCHSLQAGRNMIGPSLAGIMGRKAGAEAGFNYSPALKQANITWTPETLAAYLADPQKNVPGNRMPFPGLKSAHERQDVIAFLAQASGAPGAATASSTASPQSPATAAPGAPPAQEAVNRPPPVSHGMPDMPDIRYTLRSGIAEGQMVYLGVGGAIDGQVNPVLTAAQGQMVQITLINGEGAAHDVVFPDQNAQSPRVTGRGASTTIAFRAEKTGDFLYYCSVPGHRLAGMEGKFVVTPRPPESVVAYADISRDPADLPGPVGERGPQTVRVDLVTVELEGRLAEGTSFGYWTFNGKVPGPFVRARVGDRIEVHVKNSADSSMVHSVDFHAATGPGGGAAVLQVNPGDEKTMTFKALVPGLYVYHCATPMVAEHIANGMYGLILVEPEQGLPKVDHEFYVMQGEIYTDAAFGQQGSHAVSVEKLLNERPEYFVFNGSVGAISKLHPLHAKTGDTVRVFFGVGGPNFTSSFHVIGEIFDKVYDLGGLLTQPREGIQTVLVPAGGAVIAEFRADIPGNYALVDHALSRAERGLAGTLIVEGSPNLEVYTPMPDSVVAGEGASPPAH